MTAIYESDATNWAGIRVVEAWTEYPFVEFGDSVSKEYKMRCRCKIAEYETPALTDVMSSAAVAKVLTLAPFSADANARFVGDTVAIPADGGQVEFVRTFALVPSGYTETVPFTHTYPEKRGWLDRAALGQEEEYATILNNLENLPHPPFISRPALTKDVLAKVTRTFSYETDFGVGIGLDTVLTISRNNGPEKIVIDPGAGDVTFYNINCPALDRVVYLCNAQTTYADTVTPTLINWPATVPTITTYETAVTNGDLMIVKSYVEQYKGNIFVKVKIEVPYV